MLLDWSPTWETQPQITSSTTLRIDTGALHQFVEDDGGQIGGVHAGQPAVSLPDRRPHRLDDDRFTHTLLRML